MRHFFISVLFLSGTVVSPAWAGDEDELPDVVINGPDIAAETTTHNVIIDRETIENSSAVTLNDLLQESGIAVQQGSTPYENTTTNLRGFATGLHDSEANAHLLFLINGKRSGVTNARQLTTANIERIEIIRGPQVYRYAASSPGGIINIITRRGGPQAFAGQLEAGYGSYGRSDTLLSLNGADDNFDYALSGQYGNIKGDYKDGNGDTVKHSSSRDTRAASGNMGYTFSDNHRVSTEFYYYTLGKGNRPYYYNEEEGKVEPPSVVWRDTWLMHFNYDGHTDDNALSWALNYGLSEDAYESIKDPAARTHNMGQKVKTRQLNAGVDYAGDWLDISFGADYINYITYNSGTPKPALGYPDGMKLHLGHTTKDYGFYLINTLKLFDNTLNITGGLRYDYWNVRDKKIGDEPFLDPSRRKGGWYDDFLAQGWRPTKRRFDHLSPALGVSYLPVDGLKLRANYTQNFRAPSGRQLFSSDATEGYGAPGDPRLKAELTDTYELGFDLALNPIAISTSWFSSEMRNHITIRGIQDPEKGKGPSAQNAWKRRMEGIEVGLSADLTEMLGYDDFSIKTYFNLTHMIRSQELMHHRWDGRPLSYAGEWMPITGVPKNLISYGVHFDHPGWRLNTRLNFNYFGNTWGGQSPTYVHPNNFGRYGGFTIANFTAQRTLWQFDNTSALSAKLVINNLFNKTYAYKYNAPASTPYMQGRNYYLGLSYSF